MKQRFCAWCKNPIVVKASLRCGRCNSLPLPIKREIEEKRLKMEVEFAEYVKTYHTR